MGSDRYMADRFYSENNFPRVISDIKSLAFDWESLIAHVEKSEPERAMTYKHCLKQLNKIIEKYASI